MFCHSIWISGDPVGELRGEDGVVVGVEEPIELEELKVEEGEEDRVGVSGEGIESREDDVSEFPLFVLVI